jgi:tRNA-specific 2-thiouridylase
VRLRHRHRGAGCTIAHDAGGARVVLDEPTVGVTPGQAAVWYQGERVLGGGWITPRGEEA